MSSNNTAVPPATNLAPESSPSALFLCLGHIERSLTALQIAQVAVNVLALVTYLFILCKTDLKHILYDYSDLGAISLVIFDLLPLLCFWVLSATLHHSATQCRRLRSRLLDTQAASPSLDAEGLSCRSLWKAMRSPAQRWFYLILLAFTLVYFFIYFFFRICLFPQI